MVVSQNEGTQYRPQNIIVLIIGTPKMVPLILGNLHITGIIEGILGVLTPLQATLGPEDDVRDSLGFQARTGQV